MWCVVVFQIVLCRNKQNFFVNGEYKNKLIVVVPYYTND